MTVLDGLDVCAALEWHGLTCVQLSNGMVSPLLFRFGFYYVSLDYAWLCMHFHVIYCYVLH
jgi:hypothetical protein